MDKTKLIEAVLERGKSSGFTDMEVYIQGSSSLDIKVFNKELDKYTIADGEGMSFRGTYNGNMGYAYSEKVDESSIDMLIEEAKENASILESEDKEYIFEGSESYREVISYNEELEKVDTIEKIKFVKELEKEAFKVDSRVESVSTCIYGESSGYSILANSKGLKLEDKSNIAYGYISVKVKDGEDIKTADSYILSNDFSKFDYKKLARESVSEALSMLGAKPISSGDYEVILRNDVAGSLLEAFSGIFSAEAVQKDLSLLKGKLGEKIAVDALNIVDDPFLENGMGSTGFDSEGVATKYKKLIENGELKTFLHSLKTAKKDGTEPTGNGFKGYKSSVSIGPTNLYIQNGDSSFDELVSSTEKGLLIIDLQGLHSGLNPVSGDFSLSAYGHLIENGKLSKPVNQITVAGNFYDLIKEIELIGNDLELIMSGNIGSPSIKISKLSVAGE
jgi:PmbA protein